MLKKFPIYINVGSNNSESYVTMTIDKFDYDQIDSNLYTQFRTKEIADCVNVYFNERNDSLPLPCVEFIRRHIKSQDSELQSVILGQEHNCFTIIVNGPKCFVWGSTPSDSKDYSEKHGAFLIKSYQDINK
jgi:hypothetical protein